MMSISTMWQSFGAHLSIEGDGTYQAFIAQACQGVKDLLEMQLSASKSFSVNHIHAPLRTSS